MVHEANLVEVFTYHPPTDDQPKRYQASRNAAMNLAEVILENAPKGADQQAAIRKVREAMMTANAAVAMGGVV